MQLAVTRKIVAELNDFDNLYYEICNEPYFGGVTMRLAAPHRRRRSSQTEKTLPRKHLISQNIANGRQEGRNAASRRFDLQLPLLRAARHRGHELRLEQGHRRKRDGLPRHGTTCSIAREGWDFLLAGGGLYNNLDYSFTPPHPDGDFRDYRSPGGGSPELRKQLGILKRFLEGFDFVRMKPGNNGDPAAFPTG